jgi:hypothetical protein
MSGGAGSGKGCRSSPRGRPECEVTPKEALALKHEADDEIDLLCCLMTKDDTTKNGHGVRSLQDDDDNGRAIEIESSRRATTKTQ